MTWMTFTALLTKELRQRLRRERFIWIVVLYLGAMGMIGFLYLLQLSSFGNRSLSSQVGQILYALFAVTQVLLIMFIAPAFTSTAINGEKERQTFDLLLCSRISAFSLLAGKLVAGLATVLLLIAASAPLFSLVFFFGGVAPTQVLCGLLVFVVTALMTGMFGLFFSTILRRPPVSTALTYVLCVAWALAPLVFLIMLNPLLVSHPNRIALLLSWNPIEAILNTFITNVSPFNSLTVGSLQVAPWVIYILLDLMVSVVLFLICMRLIKPVTPQHQPWWQQGEPLPATPADV